MSFKIGDITWEPKTAAEHADLIIDKINELLQENNVTDKDGNIIQLNKNYGNALYLLALGDGERFADNDAALSKAKDSFNIELADEQQIENLLPIAAITRNPGSYSTLKLTVTASEDGPCTVPAGTKAPFENMNFVTQAEAIIPAGTTQTIDTVADTIGPIVVLTGEITSFDAEIANLESVENLVSSVPGNAAETTDSLRRRILKGQTIPYSLDGVKLALEELTGVNNAKVYLNVDVSDDETLPGEIVISARTAYIVINGDSEKIAETYAKYMNAPTQNAPGASPTGSYTTVDLAMTAGENAATVPAHSQFVFDGVAFENATSVEIAAEGTQTVTFTAVEVGAINIPSGTITLAYFTDPIENIVNVSNSASVPGIDKTAYTQNYITSSGQTIPIKYDKATNQTVFVKVFVKGGDDFDSVKNQVKRDLTRSSATWQIGESITSLITGLPFKDCTYTTVEYTKVSTDGMNWEDIISVAANAIPRVSDNTIMVEQL